MVEALGSLAVTVEQNSSVNGNSTSAYGPHERDVMVQHDTRVAPEGHKKLYASAAMNKFDTEAKAPRGVQARCSSRRIYKRPL
ncbi:hypothetical protein K503DRAFT_814903 [Rhizopogon vinicolor AM-OR11-026]|uniref:Uncharacterized protein n=1 Tax=Rhizopogon vinicolor AM-OR11-026 TaxID=1314800 RepID=A0A1B7N2E4_9AGAM|nr:hypothetical protein K503DRAFT_814903 [Rhizopogon vinicolor AM-OR11-026]